MDKIGDKQFGFFGGQMEVQEKIEELKNEGYPSDNIYVIAKDNEQIQGLRSYSDVHFSTEQDGDWIDKFKVLFSGNSSLKNVFEEMGFSRQESEQYNRRIENGDIFLFADDEGLSETETVEATTATDNTHEENKESSEPAKMSRTERRKMLSGTEEESLFLHEEQLNVHKELVQTGEININKRIVEEQQDMDVPIERDDVAVERRPVADSGNPDEEIKKEPYYVGDELHIPVVEERLVVTKIEVVTEEIVVTKRKITDTEHVSETIRREEVEIDDSDAPTGDRNG